MSRLQLTLVILAAVLLFWAVGAHNRLMRLRNAVLSAFAPVDQQLAQRHALLQQLVEQAAGADADQAQAWSAVRAASTQANAARALASTRPGSATAAQSLRLAEHILAETRARIAPPHEGGADVAELQARLASIDAALPFSCSRFNDAVLEYNSALQQFPTWLLSRLLGFRSAGAL